MVKFSSVLVLMLYAEEPSNIDAVPTMRKRGS